MCNTLWPEHIETGYRLGNARKNAPDHVSHGDLMKHLEGLRARLALHNLVMLWLGTFRPGRWIPGERHYWRSWMRLWLPGRLTKRASYLRAIAIAKLLAELSCVLASRPGCPCGGEVRELMSRLARQLLNRGGTPPITRLLHPERTDPKTPEHDHAWHLAAAHNGSYAAIYRSGQHRRRLGWLALFNAACFFSLAIELAPAQIPDTFCPEDWEDDCARAAIREIGILVRQPRHELEPDWLAKDADLAAVRGSPAGRAWACFVGLETGQAAKPAATAGGRRRAG
jgi:hypothetical protein